MKPEQKRLYYDPDQLRELVSTTNSLRESHLSAIHVLRTLRCPWLTRKQYITQSKLLAVIAQRISYLVSTQEQLQEDAQGQSPTLIVLEIGTLCNDCRHAENTRETNQPYGDDQLASIALIHKHLYLSRDELSRELQKIQQHLFRRSMSSRLLPSSVYVALHRLGNALHRERRYLRGFVVRQSPKIEVQDSENCVSCGKTLSELEMGHPDE